MLLIFPDCIVCCDIEKIKIRDTNPKKFSVHDHKEYWIGVSYETYFVIPWANSEALENTTACVMKCRKI